MVCCHHIPFKKKYNNRHAYNTNTHSPIFFLNKTLKIQNKGSNKIQKIMLVKRKSSGTEFWRDGSAAKNSYASSTYSSVRVFV